MLQSEQVIVGFPTHIGLPICIVDACERDDVDFIAKMVVGDLEMLIIISDEVIGRRLLLYCCWHEWHCSCRAHCNAAVAVCRFFMRNSILVNNLP